MMIIKLYIEFIVCLCLIIIPRRIKSLNIYVDCNAQNSGSGTSESSPCSSLSCALLQCTGSNNDYNINIEKGSICTGTKNENLVINQTNSYTFIGKDSNIIIESSLTGSRAFFISNAIDITMINITIQNFFYLPDFNQNNIDEDSGGAIDLVNVTYANFENMIFFNNTALVGGSISVTNVKSNLQINNCTFKNNVAGLGGGAISITGANTLIKDSHFILNQANFVDNNIQEIFYEGSGGAISFSGINDTDLLTIVDSDFYNNSAFSRGGAIFHHQTNNIENSLSVYGTNFFYNYAFQTVDCSTCDIEGGAIYVDSKMTYFENSLFTNNFAGLVMSPNIEGDQTTFQVARGGAMYAIWSLSSTFVNSVITLNDCSFKNNQASAYGGALYLLDVNTNFSSGTNFQGNIAGSIDNLFLNLPTLGGAIYFEAKSLPDSSTMIDCLFINNIVIGGWGGAIYSSYSLDAGGIKFVNVNFYNNTAFSSYTFSSQGGAVMISSMNIIFDDCTFSNNSAQPIFITPYTFSGYGGAVFAQSASLAISLCTFSSNYAFSGNEFDSGSGGGAIFYIHSNNCTITQSNFLLNGAVGYQSEAAFVSSGKGGAIFIKFSAIQIYENTIFYRNWASSGSSQGSQGGAIAVYESFTPSYDSSTYFGSTVNNSVFMQNVALSSICNTDGGGFGQGGAIVFSDSKSFTFFNVTFEENIALSSSFSFAETIGGAIAIISGSIISIYSSSFQSNVVLGTGFGDDLCVLSEFSKSNSYTSNLTVENTMFSTKISEFWDPWSSNEGDTTFEAFTDEICNTVNYYTSSSISYMNNKFNAIAFKKYTNSNKYNELIRKLSDIKSNSDDKHKHRRLKTELRDIIAGASILINSGFAYFYSPSFITSTDVPYKVYVGNIISTTNSGSNLDDYSPAQLTIQEIQSNGNQTTSNLKLVVYKGNLQVQSDRLLSTSIKIQDLILINSTLSTSNNLTIFGRSYLISSTINRYNVINIGGRTLIPSINFYGSIVTGLGIRSHVFEKLGKLPSFLFNVSSLYDGVCIQVYGNITVLPPFFQNPNTNESAIINLTNNASLVLKNGSSMKLLTGTLINSSVENTIALSNSGTIYLQGANELYNVLKDLQDSTSPMKEINFVQNVIDYFKNNFHFQYANYEQYSKSIYSPLSIYGGFEQTGQGKMIINIFSNGTVDEAPILYLTSNQSFLGTVHVNILSKTRVTLASATPDPTSWTFAAFKSAEYNAAGQADFVTDVPGFDVSSSATAPKSSSNGYWVSSLSVSGLACEELFNYYDFSSNVELCSVCSMNSSCSLCASKEDPTYTCVSKGRCPANQQVQKNCCLDCHGAGVASCQVSDNDATCQCKSNFVYNVHNHCAFPGYGIKVFLALLGSFIFLILLFVFSYRYNKGQKGKVIEELRQNLLSSQDGIGNTSNKTLKVIQSLQQDLILKDVFVRYEDLKLESKIGEGSYGVVYKATFRGAQVAVKQMRSPLFVDLTQNDIEEFRKEAYMMSRLRHPNIVLVMGISLIDIEPIRKRISSVNERTESSGSSKSKKEAKRTVCIITEYLEQGSLADILYGPSRLPADVWTYELILTCALQAARGMLYLHSHSPPICHRDLKCSNLVVDDHWVVKVTDFGMSRIIPEKIQDLDIGVSNRGKDVEDQLKYFFGRETEAPGSVHINVKDNDNYNRITERSGDSTSNLSISQNLEMTSNLGTTAWCAPELFTAGSTARYSVKVDVYSFGMVLWELWEKRRPFDNLTSRFDIMDAVREGLRPDISSSCPPAFRSLIERCWEAEPSRRPMFKYIVRYLKEELAQVKRMQTATGPNRSISTDIATRLVNRVEDNEIEASSPSSLRANIKNILSWAQSKESTENDTSAVPSSRAPLTIFDRGLSHLAGSPAVMSESVNSLTEQPGFKTGGGGGNRGAWRDRYVMKFSGWKTSQPDVGLPPSLGVGSQTANPMLSPQSNYQDGTEIFDMECEGNGSPEIQLSNSNRSNK